MESHSYKANPLQFTLNSLAVSFPDRLLLTVHSLRFCEKQLLLTAFSPWPLPNIRFLCVTWLALCCHSVALSKARQPASDFSGFCTLSDNGNTGGKQGDGCERPGSGFEDTYPGCDQELHLSAQAKYVANASYQLTRLLCCVRWCSYGRKRDNFDSVYKCSI